VRFVLVSRCVSWIKAAQKFSTSNNRMNKLRFSSCFFRNFMRQRLVLVCGVTALLLVTLGQALGQPAIISTVPATGATGISSNASVVFTFSTSMDTNRITVQLYSSIPTPRPFYRARNGN
jgi:hypothetical protein